MSHLKSLILSDCAITEKSINLLGAGLLQAVQPNNELQQLQITCLDFSGNTIKDEANDLLQFMSLCENLRILNLSDTNFSVDRLWGSLRFGGLQIETLKLSGCQCNRRNKEALQHMKEYFGSAVALNYIDFSNTILGSEALKYLLVGLVNNQQLKPYILILDSTADKGFVQALEGTLCDLDAKSLSFRDNGLDADAFSIISSCRSMEFLTSLDLSGSNFVNLKKSTRNHGLLTNIMVELVKLIGDEKSKLSQLILCDCRLGTHLSVLLNALGVSTSLQLLDITGNEIGNFGARLLAKALQVNLSLRTVVMDRNQVTGDGYTDIAHALALNTTLTSFPYPIIDAAESLSRADRAKTIAALTEIETVVAKNRMGVKKDDAYYRMMMVNLQQDLFGKVDSDWKLPKLNAEFVKIVEELPHINESNDEVMADLESTLSSMEDKAMAKAKEILTPVTDIANSEKIEYSHDTPRKDLPLREAVVSSTIDYLNKMKWETIGKVTAEVLVALRTLDVEGRLQSENSSSASDVNKLQRPIENEDERGGESPVDIDSLPSSFSLLRQINKPRPKRSSRGKACEYEDSRSVDSVSEKSVSSETSFSQREDKPPVAMPRHTILSVNTQMSPPPIVPRRNRIAAIQQPPVLPPKPSASQRSLNSLDE
uniref:CARMIL_C domain-containing protein n=1 Tax=Syphacia muris TaxID=451379 RepID=A0A0N5B0S5_9BILA